MGLHRAREPVLIFMGIGILAAIGLTKSMALEWTSTSIGIGMRESLKMTVNMVLGLTFS